MTQRKHRHHDSASSNRANNLSKPKRAVVPFIYTISIERLFLFGSVVYLLIIGVIMNHLALLPNLNNMLMNISPLSLRIGKKEGSSACLLVNDENPRLPEWIAYHYQTLPLRSLTVAVDPASRSSPLDILQRWNKTGLIEVQLWNDDDFLYDIYDDGTKEWIEVTQDVLGHRTRQNYFINKCMADFKRRNKQWVLLIDVDEYIVLNRIDDKEPDFPLEKAPDGIPTVMDWDTEDRSTIDGWIFNQSDASTRNVSIGPFISQAPIRASAVVTDMNGNSYFLRDDKAVRDLAAMDLPPEPMPTFKHVLYTDTGVCGDIYGDIYNGEEDEEWVCVDVDFETPYDQQKKKNIGHGGYVIEDEENRKYFLEKEQVSWPKRLTLKEAKVARERLPRVGERKTILDVVREESNRYGADTMGPCVIMPRLRYGSFESIDTTPTERINTAGGFNPHDFVTLRYRFHGNKGEYAYGKSMIDVSRIPIEELNVEAANVHSPLCHYCPRQWFYYNPQYATSLFRVNHYLDTYEAYSYRNDTRVELRKNVDRYNELSKEGNYSMDTVVSLWLQEFVQDLGSENAKMLLAGAGYFPRLDQGNGLDWSLWNIISWRWR